MPISVANLILELKKLSLSGIPLLKRGIAVTVHTREKHVSCVSFFEDLSYFSHTSLQGREKDEAYHSWDTTPILGVSLDATNISYPIQVHVSDPRQERVLDLVPNIPFQICSILICLPHFMLLPQNYLVN